MLLKTSKLLLMINDVTYRTQVLFVAKLSLGHVHLFQLKKV